MEKKKFTEPELEVILLAEEDVITSRNDIVLDEEEIIINK